MCHFVPKQDNKTASHAMVCEYGFFWPNIQLPFKMTHVTNNFSRKLNESQICLILSDDPITLKLMS